MGFRFGLPGSLDESRKQSPRELTFLPSTFRMPLDSNNEPAADVFDSFDDTVGGSRRNSQVVAGQFNALMVEAIDVHVL